MGASRTRSDGDDDRTDGPIAHAEVEADLAEREARINEREAVDADRKNRRDGILADAAARDEVADARDEAADRRDGEASLDAFLKDDTYTEHLPARRAAAQDRLYSKTDRDSAAHDRDQLTDDEPQAPAPDGG